MRRLTFLTLVAGATALAAVGLAGPAVAATTTVTVTSNDIGSGWTLYSDNGASGDFVAGPAPAPVGVGSFQFTIPNNGKVTLSTNAPAGQALSAVDTVSYATYRDSSSTMPANVAPSLNMEICAGGVTGSTCNGYTTLVWEPVYAYGTTANGNNPVTPDSWQTWNALDHTSTSYTGGWWSTHTIGGVCAFNCFVSLAEIQAANPDAVILSFGVNVGHGPGGTFNGNADALTLGIAGSTTTYDLEPVIALTDKSQCKNGGWATSNTPVFRNQGECVSHFASGGKAGPHGS